MQWTERTVDHLFTYDPPELETSIGPITGSESQNSMRKYEPVFRRGTLRSWSGLKDIFKLFVEQSSPKPA